MRLYLVRHGEAAKTSETGGLDADRKLTSRGEEDISLMGKLLNRIDGKVGHILTSPFARAEKTGQILAAIFGADCPVIPTEKLAPGFRMRPLLEEITQFQNDTSLLMVGHQPDLGIFLTYLIGGGSAGVMAYSPGAVAAIEYEPGSGPGKGILQWFLSPDMVRRILSP
jgi:phosphohistidine phosphatase